MQPQRDCFAKRRKVSREEDPDPIHCARHCIGCFLEKDEGRKKLKTGTFRPCAPRFQCFKIACVLRSQRASVHEGTDDAVQCRSAMLLPILETEKKGTQSRASDGVKRKKTSTVVAFELKSREGVATQHTQKKSGVSDVAI